MIYTLLRQQLNIRSLLNKFYTNTDKILFLRKGRLFVKSRYSRNRQWSKSIVYFGLWFNIISVTWSIYYCYRYMFIFSYFFWLAALFVLIGCIRLYQPINTHNLYIWLVSLTFRY